MKIIVFSDSHGSADNMRRAVADHPDADYFIHLGDGTREFRTLTNGEGAPFIALEGNYEAVFAPPPDPAGDPPARLVLDLGGLRLLLCHGHRYHVKYGLESLAAAAREAEADIACYGHTHIAHDEYIPPRSEGERPLRLFNPGSVSLYGGGMPPSYGIISYLPGQGIVTSTARFV